MVVLISKALRDSNISHDKYFLVTDVRQESNDRKETFIFDTVKRCSSQRRFY